MDYRYNKTKPSDAYGKKKSSKSSKKMMGGKKKKAKNRSGSGYGKTR
jgi:hypothetical protein